jgi:microcystin-dependent protein
MSQSYVGECRMFAGDFAPEGWAFCDGRLLPIADYDTLYKLIGTAYGGDGEVTFALPDLQGRVPMHHGNGFNLAETGGVESVTLRVSELAAHHHQLFGSSGNGNTNLLQGQVLSANPTQVYNALRPFPNAAMDPRSIALAGGDDPHDNLQPYVVLSWIVSLVGGNREESIGPEAFLSELRCVSFSSAASGWLMCNGQLLAINEHKTLYSLLGTTYGGDGRVTFGLPNLQGRAPMHMSEVHTLGEVGGEYTHTLSVAELPKHVHALQGIAATSGKTTAAGHMLANTSGGLAIYGPPNSLAPMFPGDVSNNGGNRAHANQSPFLVMTWIIASVGRYPGGNLQTAYVGEIRVFPFGSAPPGWNSCNGQILRISENMTLFLLLGTTYGGDGVNNFALPNLQGAIPIGQAPGRRDGKYSLGESAGSDTVALTGSEMPSHTHMLMADQAHHPDNTAPTNAAVSQPAAIYSSAGAPIAQFSGSAIAPAGDGQPHNNLMPYVALNFCICLQGIFATRPRTE